MNDFPSRDEVAARLEAAEARTDTKFAELVGEVRVGFAAINGRLDAINGRIDATNDRVDALERSTSGIKTTVILTGIAAVAVVVAVMGYGQTWFGLGMNAREIVKATVAETIQQEASKPK